MSRRAVLFDLDGTLLDSIALILASYRHTLGLHGVPAPADGEIVALLGMPLEDCMRTWTADAARIASLVDGYRTHNLAHHDEMVRSYPGVTELVRALAAADRPRAVVTSKRRAETERGLRAIGLEGTFPVLVCAGDTPRGKPDPAPVRLALDRLGVEPADAVFVGDSTHDLVAGRAAGVETIAVLWGPFPRAVLEAERPMAMAASARELEVLLSMR